VELKVYGLNEAAMFLHDRLGYEAISGQMMKKQR